MIIKNFIVFEGADGAGTSTQLDMLKNRLTEKGLDFYADFEPTSGLIGQLIRRALKKDVSLPAGTGYDAKTLCHLFAADRNEHLYGHDGIIKRAESGQLVTCDRYAISSLVYQGLECGDEFVQSLNSGFPAPELTLFFDLKPEVAMERLSLRSSLDIYENLDFQKKVYQKYLQVIKDYAAAGARVEIIDASKPVNEVAEQVWAAVFSILK